MDLAFIQQITRRLCEKQGWRELIYIDAGNSGAVFKTDHPKYGPVALKIYDPSYFEGENALIEENRVRLQEKLRSHGNPYVIDIHEVGKIEEDNTWYLLMELCPWQNLEKCLGMVTDDKVEELLRQLVDAAEFLEERGLVHRDIKPANIAIDPSCSKLKLLDLGVLRRIGHTEGNGTDHAEKKRFVATAQYSSPEYLTREELPGEDGFRALNIYQVGAVLHDLIMKSPLFQEEAATLNKYILYKAITTKLPLIVNPNLPPRLISRCKAALRKDPTSRLGAVSLSQLSVKNDTTEDIRKRLGASRPTNHDRNAPSILIWQTRVRDWLREAAIREKSTLGAHRLKAQDHPEGVGWRLSFLSNQRELVVTLEPSSDKSHLVLAVSAQVPEQLTIPLLEIFESGPQIDSEEVLSQLSSNILYILDL